MSNLSKNILAGGHQQTPKNYSIKATISDYIKDKKNNVSYAEMSRDIEDFDGNQDIHVPPLNIVIWSGISLEAVTSLNELQAENKIDLTTISEISYLIDGFKSNHPIAKDIPPLAGYKEPHWLPLAFNWIGGEKPINK